MNDVAVIGAGVNGICCAISLAEKGCKVVVYESKTPFAETSSKSSKLLHGGIRYLENLQIKLVRESLADRACWMEKAGQHTKASRFFIPVYKNRSRSRPKLYFGVKLYQWLSGKNSLGKSQYHSKSETLELNPELSEQGLLGSVSYIDVQMDDRGLSEWLKTKAESLGVIIKTNTFILRVDTDGSITEGNGEKAKYRKVVNACGPWAKKLIDDSYINSKYSLVLVRGSHLIVDRVLNNPLVIQEPEEARVVFALPFQGKTLIGTTESIQENADQIECTDQELVYLINAANLVLDKKIELSEVINTYAGVRPIVTAKQKIDAIGKATRESVIETVGDLINVFGGKWTSAMRLGKKVSDLIDITKEQELC